jgi:hypothetical protein
MTTISDTTVSPVIVPDGKTVSPFSLVTVSDLLQTTEVLTVTLSALYYYPPISDFGTLTDPLGGGSFDPNTHTFTESAIVTGTPTPASQILNRLIYTPPTLNNGTSINVDASISVNGIADPKPVRVERSPRRR